MESWIENKLSILFVALSGIFLLIAVGLYAYSVHLTAELDKSITQVAQLQFANQEFKATVDKQNASIIAWRQAAIDARTAAQAAIAAAAEKAKTFAQKADAIRGYHTSGNDCEVADKLISAYIRGDVK